MKAFIFAAGLGTRLQPITNTIPKALVPVVGKPLLQHLIEKMKASGISDIVVNVHHFADQIVDFVHANNDFGIRIAFSDERAELLETGGGIKHAEPLLGKEPFIVHNVDILSNVNLCEFAKMHTESALATLLVSQRESSRHLLFDNKRLVGWTNMKTGEVKSPYGNINPDNYEHLAFSGIHILSPTIFPLMTNWPHKFSIIDFYLSVANKVEIKGVEIEGLQLLDVGKIDTLKQAEKFV